MAACLLSYDVLMPAAETSSAPAPFRVWICVVCGFLYSEADGLPEEGIEPGTRWDEVPETWTCPDCGVGKSDFEMIQVD